MNGSAVNPAQFKRALGLWASGVTVVSTRANGRVHCMTASSFSSLSVEPLQVIVCVARSARLHELARASGAFAVNILREDQRALGEAFARSGREPDEIAGLVDTFDGPTGSPIFSPCLAYLDCRLGPIYDGGDHSIFVGDVVAVGSDESALPLLYFNRSYRGLRDLEG